MNGEEGVVKGQMERREVKRSEFPADESDPEFNDLNPFLIEPVLVKLLKLVNKVSQLKELRKMCQTWDEFNLKELEDRAFNGRVKHIDFCWASKFRTISEGEDDLVQFLRDTSAIPRLFASFKFNFPESWTILQNHMEFFSIYPVTFVHLGIPGYLAREQIRLLMIKFMETELWGNLKEIILYDCTFQGKFGLPPSSVFIESSGNNTKKLHKLYMQMTDKSFHKIFKSAFASGKYTNLTSMRLDDLPGGNFDFPGLDLYKLTQLELGSIEDKSRGALKFTSGLVNLAGNGMKLKNFGMRIDLTKLRFLQLPNDIDEFFFANLPLICSNLTQFLSTQSSTLVRLSFEFVCYLKDPVEMEEAERCKIHLPKFEALRFLKLWVDFQLIEANPRKIHTQLFGMSEYPSGHFPKLVALTLDYECSLISLRVNPAPDEAGGLQLKRLEISEYYVNPPVWNTSFVGVIGSVEYLLCHAHLFRGEILPWGKSLRSLYIRIINVGVEQLEFFKLNHFKKLERISTRYIGIDGRKINSGLGKHRSTDVEQYLNTFKEATDLPLTSIEFYGPNMEEEMKEQFFQYFPFPVQFQIKP